MSLFRYFVLILLVIHSVFSPLASAQDRYIGDLYDVEERVLDPAQIREENTTRIILADGTQYEFAKIPDVEIMKQSLGLKISDEMKREILAHGGSVEENNPMEPYVSLPDDRKQQFQIARMFFLRNAARILHSSRLAFGAGTLVNDAFSFLKPKTKTEVKIATEPGPGAKRGLSDKGQKVIQTILTAIDYKLWSQAPLVIDANEIGVSASIGFVAETGVLNKGSGGAEEIGLSISMNKSTRAFVFEIFHNSENFVHTRAAVSVIGVVGKTGIVLGRRTEVDVIKGNSFYPPAVPGYSSASPSYFSAGMSSSIGLPPPPLADLLTFTNRFERNSLVRVTLSPLIKGYVRFEFGDFDHSARLVAMRFVDVYLSISEKIFKHGRRSCGAVFN